MLLSVFVCVCVDACMYHMRPKFKPNVRDQTIHKIQTLCVNSWPRLGLVCIYSIYNVIFGSWIWYDKVVNVKSPFCKFSTPCIFYNFSC